MTTLTAFHLLDLGRPGRPAADRRRLDALRALLARLGRGRPAPMGPLPAHLLRDLGLDGVDLRAL